MSRSDDGWDDFPVILGFGGVNELSDATPTEPRLAGMRSVSAAAAVALHRKANAIRLRSVGFAPQTDGLKTGNDQARETLGDNAPKHQR